MLKKIKKTISSFAMGFVLPTITMVGLIFPVILFIGGTITLVWFFGPLAPVITLGGISVISGLATVWNGWNKKK